MNKKDTTIIRLSKNEEIRKALLVAKKKYPTLTDSEILKLGLSKIVTEGKNIDSERADIRRGAAYSVGEHYLEDSEEDLYTKDMGDKVSFS